MGLTETSTVASEPLTLEQAKAHLRVDATAEDTLLQSYIASARQYAERVTGRAFGERTFELTLSSFPVGTLYLPRPPLVQVDEITYLPANGSTRQTLPADQYLVDATRAPATVEPVERWPGTARAPDAVRIAFTAGSPVPDTALLAMQQLVAHWDANRLPVSERGDPQKVPISVDRLLRGLRAQLESVP
jgi:uncharacterized phiE125 gp8 family phage protein